VLLHDTKRQTAQMLPALLRELKRRGYRIVHVVPAKAAAPAPN
jgi:peptidoglycan-N-acetylglucosamine deacetylase